MSVNINGKTYDWAVRSPSGGYSDYGMFGQGSSAGSSSSSSASSSSSSSSIAGSAMSDAKSWDAYYESKTKELLAKYMPEWQNTLNTGVNFSKQFMQQTLPTLVAGMTASFKATTAAGMQALTGQPSAGATNAVRQSRAESAQTRGLSGQIEGGLRARDLGLTSEQIKQTGLAFLSQADSTASGLAKLNTDTAQQLGLYAGISDNLLKSMRSPDNTLSSFLNSAGQESQLKFQAADNAASLAEQARQFNVQQSTAALERNQSIAMNVFSSQMANIRDATSFGLSAYLNPQLQNFSNSLNSRVNTMNSNIANFASNITGTGVKRYNTVA